MAMLVALVITFEVPLNAEARRESINLNLVDSDPAFPVLGNFYMKGFFDRYVAAVRYVRTADVPGVDEGILLTSKRAHCEGLHGVVFALYPKNHGGVVSRVQWAIPDGRDFGRDSVEALRGVLEVALPPVNGERKESVLAYALASGDRRISDLAYEESDGETVIRHYTLDVTVPPSHSARFWRSFGGIVLLNGLGAIDYMMNLDTNTDDWKYPISAAGFKRKLADGMTLDANNFTTNCVGHVYSGNLYYNAARSNGYGFYGSMMFAIAGSLMWEYLGEFKEEASLNDLFATGIGGPLFGETLHQTGLFVEKNMDPGFFRSVLVLVLDPLRVINRALDRSSTSSYKINVSFISPAQAAAEGLRRRQ
ncbi:MAG TPA: DUF3943 domain-containing protein [Spirochaetota bacterium]|nr:DUF3943 domain-containing protein [Spirochaetota bacterium]